LWPAVTIAEGAGDEEDFNGFNVCNKEVHKMVSLFEKMDPSNPKYEVSQVGVEEWIDEDIQIEVSCTTAYEDLINAVMNTDADIKLLRTDLQMKKSSQRKCFGLKLLMHIPHF
jgi:hypothetical protein